MQAQQFPDLEFRKLNELIHAFCAKNPSVREFFECDSQLDEIAKAAINRKFATSHYEALSAVLREQYRSIMPIEAVEENLNSFIHGNAITVTTGHQLCLLGGPAYFFYKILSTIKLAQQLQPLVPNRKIVPVFWMASEDHDWEEINHTYVNGTRLDWQTQQHGPVGRFSLDGFADVLGIWMDSIVDENLRSTLIPIWNRAMQAKTWADLTKSWVHECFGEWGLVVINGDDARLKKLFVPILKRELLEGVAFYHVSQTNGKLRERGYHVQVNPREINLFYLGAQSRVRIERIDNTWHTVDHLRTWNEEGLCGELEEHPENFSPNVLLRPLYQETVLPNVAYVGGPGELAYWLQLRQLFHECEVPMPALVLRDSAIILSPTACKRLSKLGLNAEHVLREKPELVALLAGERPDFSTEKEELLHLYEKLAQRIATVDPTLKATALAEAQRMLTGVDQLQAKTWKAIKTKEEQKLTTLDKLWDEIYPSNNWQERSHNLLKEAYSENKQLLHLLLREFQPPTGTLVIVEP